ncbi:HEPN domain-containing protein [uncultured Bacteroides sp.]|uniref:HEPN domain-containing protein n=1 Tax=uncultured Bacteroides sp. TaxID=162156 RepID=UPI0025DDF36C|nr:HEPN domain-containing protein [uncultured Bacteroides sp.]
MKEKLDSESRAAIVNYRLERAYETLKEADYNTAGGYFNAAVNRLYYACYYAASALLLGSKIEANTHNGVKTQLSMHFVRTGHLSLDHGATFSLLFEKRQASDYSDFAYCDLALVNTLRPRAEAFINAMEQLINKE